MAESRSESGHGDDSMTLPKAIKLFPRLAVRPKRAQKHYCIGVRGTKPTDSFLQTDKYYKSNEEEME